MPAVSVIIPVYNVSLYIEKCARSLFEQTLTDIEYVFVNDCSTDDSLDVLNKVLCEYPKRAKSVKIIDLEKNCGIAEVRKIGIANIHGEYVIHCDSDDWIERDMYQLMYEKALSESMDIVLCDYLEENGEEVSYRHSMNEDKDLLVSTINIHGSLCTRMVSSKIVKSSTIVFPTENIGEDLALSGQYAVLTEKSGYIEKALYHYVRRSTSALGNRSSESLIKMNNALKTNFSLVVDLMLSKGLHERYEDAVIHECVFIKNVLLPVLPAHNSNKLWRNTFKDINYKVFSCKSLTKKEKLNFLITYLGIYPLYRKLVH